MTPPAAEKLALRLRPRTDADDEFIVATTRAELVPTLERAWGFKWDAGHERKFLLDLREVGRTLVAERKGDDAEPIAYVWYVVQPPRRLWARPVFWINYLIVSAPYQGRGVGGRLVARCVRLARDAGCRRMELWVQPTNEGARRFYEAHRFVAGAPVRGNIPMGRPV